MREFAEQRGLTVERRPLGELTPGLLTGSAPDEFEACEVELGDGFRGTLAHHGFAEGRTRRDSTVVLTRVPGAVAFLPALVCRDAGAMGDADLAQLPAERWQRVKLESAPFNDRYRLFTLIGQDQIWLRELFSPSLIAWLDRDAPDGLGFEVNEGNLCVSEPGHVEDPARLERLCEATAELAGRIRAEADEEAEHPDIFSEAEEIRDLDRAIPAVRWGDPPASVGAAVDAYRRVAARRPRVLFGALLWALLAAAAVAALGALLGGALVAIPLALLALVPVFIVARLVRSYRYRFGSVGVRRVALEAFVREYARSRGLQLEDRWGFHAANRELAMPGVADHSLVGELDGIGNGRFVMFGNAPEMRSRGEEVAFTADRPLAASGVLVDLGRAAPAGLEERLELPEEYAVSTGGSKLLVWRPVQGNLLRTADGSDRFLERAAGVISHARASAS